MAPHPQISSFREIVWDYYNKHGRQMPWRSDPNPYYVLVSELMLQQTQVSRVIPKFNEFIAAFPDISRLASASLAEVLGHWNGLGYNRRAKFLHLSAKKIMDEFSGTIPVDFAHLVSLPGIGPNTAGAIRAYAFNESSIFIETNIRTVFIHHFFHDQFDITDRVILELAAEALDREHPREWYWALMDYGTHLKQTAGGKINQSKQYKKQTPLAGSPREMRGRIIRALITKPLSTAELKAAVQADERYQAALQALQNEGLISQQNNIWCLTGESDIR